VTVRLYCRLNTGIAVSCPATKSAFGPVLLCCPVMVKGRAIALAVSRRVLTAEARVRAQVSPYGICGGRSGNGTSFSQSPSIFSCQYHSTAFP
jgi:hypothetical protein